MASLLARLSNLFEPEQLDHQSLDLTGGIRGERPPILRGKDRGEESLRFAQQRFNADVVGFRSTVAQGPIGQSYRHPLSVRIGMEIRLGLPSPVHTEHEGRPVA